MALDKSVVPVVFQGGVQTGTAEEVVIPGEFLVLENVVRRTQALAEKRYGFSALGRGIISSVAEVTSGVELTKFNDDLVLLNQTRVYSFSEANDAWSDRGPITSTLVGSEPIIRNTYTQAMPDSAHSGGITANVWEDERGGVRCSVVIDSTGSPTVYDFELNGSGSRPKVVVIGQYIVFVYIVGTDIRTRRVSLTVPNTVEAEVVAYGGVAQDEPMDVVPYLSGAALVFNDTSNTVTLGYLDDDGEAGAPASNGFPVAVAIPYDADQALSIVSDELNETHYVFHYDDSDALLRVTAYSADLNTSATETVDGVYQNTSMNVGNSGSFYDVVGSARGISIWTGLGVQHTWWFNVTDGANTQTVPATGASVFHQVDILTADAAADVAGKLEAAIEAASGFSSVVNVSGVQIFVTNDDYGVATSPVNHSSGVALIGSILRDIRNVTAALRADDSLVAYYEFSLLPDIGFFQVDADSYIRTNTVDAWTAGDPVTVGTSSQLVRSVGLASKAFVEAGESYIGVAFDSDLQSTYFVMNSAAEIVARIAIGLGGGLTKDAFGVAKSGLPRADLDSGGERFFPVLIRNQVEAEDDGVTLSVNTGLNRITLGFNAAEFSNAQLGQNLFIAGGILQTYDGVAVTEQGFHLYPDEIESDPFGSGSSLATGTYNYRVTYEWVDARGQTHQSAPSITESVAVTAGQNAALQIPTLRLTAKDNVQIVVWRAIKDGVAVYYRLSEAPNDPTVDLLTFTDDGSLFSTAAQILYTTGGALENTAAPASAVVHQHRNRLFLGGTENGKIAYTREHVFSEGVNFSEILTFPVDPRGGDVSALASLDRNLIILKPDAAFTLSGDGPNDAGLQNDYTRPELISGDIGCANQQSIANVPDGLMMQTRKGIWLLNRALQFEYIGEPVEDFNDEVVTSAVVFHEENEVRFTTKSGVALIYNYDMKQWSVFTNYEAEGAVLALGGRYMHLKADGTVNVETVGEYEDNGARIKMAMETSWMAFLGVQAFQRIYMLSLLGRWGHDHILSMKLAYDYEEAYTDTVYFATATAINGDEYGDGEYGEMVTYGGSSGGKYQFRHKPTHQKCEAIKIRLEDLDTVESNGGASFSLVSMSFEVGTKKGINRFGSARTIGNG